MKIRKTNNFITIKNARENNLQGIDLEIPKNKFIIFTGLSGSGKTSLAFNTIYEEGKRRYIDSLSSYARQFLGGTKKPLVDSIDGLMPSISIEQKTTHNNPRSTVGTVTEIYDYLRLLYARIGKAYCPEHKVEISTQTTEDIINSIFLESKINTKFLILAPLVDGEKGTFQKLFFDLKKEGFLRVKIDGEIYNLDEISKVEKNKKHKISLVIDRLVLEDTSEIRMRLFQAIEIAAQHGQGQIIVDYYGGKEKIFNKNFACPFRDFSMPIIETKLFSFNSPYGMCEECKGLGLKLAASWEKMVFDAKKTINSGGLIYFKNTVNSSNLEWQEFDALLDFYKIPKDLPLQNLDDEEKDIIMNGSYEEIAYFTISSSGKKSEYFNFIEGLGPKIERKFLTSSSDDLKAWYRKFLEEQKCLVCKGKRLNQYALAVKILHLNIYDLCSLTIEEIYQKITQIKLEKNWLKVAELILQELKSRLKFLINVGLDYLDLNRKAESLSGGESQRIKLATQIGSKLTGVLYVLDEPSIGLHQKDNQKLIATLKEMVEIGNTLIVVEHDEETILAADFVVDIGPKAGFAGGKLVHAGSVEALKKNSNSITGKFLAKKITIEIPKTRRPLKNSQKVEIVGAHANNLKNVNVNFFANTLIAVCGVSGSGKSSLVNEVIVKALEKKLTKNSQFVEKNLFKTTKGLENFKKIIQISQSPIGRTPRSNPATYTGVFDEIRDLFANTLEAKARGYLKGRFSFNVRGGRCENCQGDGLVKIEMQFLPDVYIECYNCKGKRYNLETLEVKYKNKNIAEILEMSVEEALEFFANKASIYEKIKSLYDVGLGYVKLGQSSTTLSGGEAQRVKLASYLFRKNNQNALYVLDEPTTGLHSYDVKKLISILNRLVDQGNTIIVIEHNLDLIKCCDYIIDLGPEGGKKGGQVIFMGTPEKIIHQETSFTGKFLKPLLENHGNKS